MLQDHRRFSSGDNKLEYAPYRTMLDLDPPDHTRLRGLVSKAFTPRAVAALGPRVKEIVDELLDDLAGKERFDLVEEFAFPLPVIVIAEMLGIPAEDRDRFNVWSNDIALAVEPVLTRAEVARVRSASDAIVAYFEEIIDQRRRRPQEDMLSALIAAEEEGDKLTHDELIGTLMLLLVAGNETTRSLIGNGMLALLKNPDQLQRLRDEPELLDSAIDELLRYDSPVQFIIRVVMEDLAFKGREMRAGAEDYDPGGRGEPRSGGFRESECAGHRAQGEEPYLFRTRDSLLPGLAAGAAGGARGVRRAAGTLSVDTAAGGAGVSESDRAAGGGGAVGGTARREGRGVRGERGDGEERGGRSEGVRGGEGEE